MKNVNSSLMPCLLATLALPSLSEAATVVSDDFETSTIVGENRLRVENTADDWVQFSGTATLDAGQWEISDGQLRNPGTTPGTASQSPIFSLVDVGAQSLPDHTQVTITFDYTVAADSTLTFYSYGYFDGTLTNTNAQLHNTGTSNGAIQSQYDSSGDFSALNLRAGENTPNGSAGTGFSLTGDGSFTLTVDLTAEGYEEVDNINDLQLLTSGFRSSGGAVSIDNFNISTSFVPEPSSTALLALGGLTLILRRRK